MGNWFNFILITPKYTNTKDETDYIIISDNETYGILNIRPMSCILIEYNCSLGVVGQTMPFRPIS